MKKGYTHWSVIIDRSGSMEVIKKAVIEGFNQLIEDQKKDEGELTVSLIQFDSNGTYWNGFNRGLGESSTFRYDILNDFSQLNEVKLLNEENYLPAGGTPLNDAVARFIEETGKRLAAMPESQRPEKVIVTIMTDGEENSSRKHTAESVRKMIEHQEQKYGWKFIYIGANQDAFKEGNSRGISSAMNFQASDIGTKSAFYSNSKTMSKMRGMSNEAYASYNATTDLNVEYKAAMEQPDLTQAPKADEKKDKEKTK
jgi:hypothetical protein